MRAILRNPFKLVFFQDALKQFACENADLSDGK